MRATFLAPKQNQAARPASTSGQCSQDNVGLKRAPHVFLEWVLTTGLWVALNTKDINPEASLMSSLPIT
ncbi:hypothetical protein NDU88_000715 [Pleurodeles waltl]|uniref:Uncharacterized protein n=1 Tax=Pleurodeles waltl TaxID=8319 RepID=A0AAV7SAF8_PLEWA|nr:hypothetical protein NDU88_000715 [Pleurodeles waltl]